MLQRAQLPPSKIKPQFLARELAVLAFNQRVLAQAEDRRVPALERLRFLCILSSNLDEFFEIRVAELKERIKLGNEIEIPGETPSAAVFPLVSERAHALVAEQYRLLNKEILPELADEGVRFLAEEHWTREQRSWLHHYFLKEMIPLLTPIGLDPSHPFPRVLNKSLNFAVQLEGRDAFGRNSGTAIVQAPRALPRVIQLPKAIAGKGHVFVLLTSILQAFVQALFQGMTVRGSYPFRVTRNSDLFLDEEEFKNLRTALAGELPQRHFGDSVRLEVADNMPAELGQFLLEQFQLTADDLYRVDGPVNLVRLMQIPDLVDTPALKFAAFIPGIPKALEKSPDLFRVIRNGDVLLHHPFQSFDPVIDFLEQSVDDPSVVAIKQTVYRTGTDSVLMKYLIDAAQRGKEVTVVVELLARFDEEANLNWAAKLEEVGAHVVYGVVGYKTHAKMSLVVRREEGKLRRYAHVSTGNYHPRTARLYTDFGLLTAAPPLDFAVLAPRTRAGGDQTRSQPRTCRKAGAHHRKNERLDRTQGDRDALPRIAGRGENRSDRARSMFAAARDPGAVREHTRALGHRTVSRTLTHFLFPQQRRGRSVPVQCRLDGAQFLRTHRTVLPRPRPQGQGARHPGRPQTLSVRQQPGMGDGFGRQLPEKEVPRTHTAFGAGAPARVACR